MYSTESAYLWALISALRITREREGAYASACSYAVYSPIKEMKHMVIKIDKYQSEIENGKIVYYALAGKKKYKMPDCYKMMYNDNYLAIEERTMAQPELYDAPATHYIPLFTGDSQ